LAQITSINNNEENLAAFEYALGEFALLTKKYDEAVSKFDASINHLNKLKLPSDLALVLFRNGIAHKLNGNAEKAFENLSSAYSISKKMGMRPMSLQISKVLNDMGINPDSRHHKEYEFNLTRRQLEILKLLPSGLSNKEISKRLFLSIRTVDMHVSNILKRLECRTRTEAVERAKENNLI
jgi:DNA-binding CsgD family transcriptional regulator